MPEPDRIPAADLPPGTVRGHGDWAVGNRGGRAATSPSPAAAGTSLPTSPTAASTPTAAWSARGTRAATTSGPARWSRARAASSATTGRRRSTRSWSPPLGRLARLRVRRAVRDGDDVVLGS